MTKLANVTSKKELNRIIAENAGKVTITASYEELPDGSISITGYKMKPVLK